MADMEVDTTEVQQMARRYQGAEPIVRAELTSAMQRSTILVSNDAKRLAPVDTGRLRSSLTQQVRPAAGGVSGVVGTNVTYGKFVEDGTRPHFPPPSALAGWASRHGFGPRGGFIVARAISRRGTRAQPYLRPALQQNLGRIRHEFGQVAQRVLARLGGR